MNTEYDEKWLSQLRKGFLELCVLLILERQESAYGLELLQLLAEAQLRVNEGTLYPMLNRMNKNGWLVSNWETPNPDGHPRRIYQLGTLGKRQLPVMLKFYLEHHQSLQTIRGEDE